MGSTETENAINFEWHTFHIFCFLAHPLAFVSAWLDTEIPMTQCSFLCRAGEKFSTLHAANSTLEFIMIFLMLKCDFSEQPWGMGRQDVNVCTLPVCHQFLVGSPHLTP